MIKCCPCLLVMMVVTANCVDGNETPMATATEGDTVRVKCRTTIRSLVDWKKQLDPRAPGTYIVVATRLMPKYKPRFEFDNDTYSLTIHNVTASDSGLYYCIEDKGAGQQHFVQLNVDIHECTSNPCLNGGTCIDGVSNYTCSCQGGYIGVNCQTDVDECASFPCENNGTCIDGVNRFTCGCVGGFTGVICHTGTNSHPNEVNTLHEIIPLTVAKQVPGARNLSEEVQEILDNALPVLCRELDVDARMCLLLLSHDILTALQVKACQAGTTRGHRVEIMVGFLKRSALSSYTKFRQILSSDEIERDDLVQMYLPELGADNESTIQLTGISTARPGEIESDAIQIIKFNELQQPLAIAEGGFGVIYCARHHRWGEVVYKELLVMYINGDDRICRDFRSEAQMFKLNHPNIIKLLGVVLEPEHYGLILEFAQHGGLNHFLMKHEIGFSLRMSFAIEVVEGMAYLHSFKPPVIHGDLKLQNVVVSVGYIAKICDFGLAKWKTFTTQQASSTGGRAGTVTHFPPEIWNDLLLTRTDKFDVYGFGILLWELLSDQVPYQQTRGNTEVIRMAVMGGERPPLSEVKCPEMFSEFVNGVIERCWNQQPDARPTFSDLKHELQQFIDEHALNVDKSKPVELRMYDN